MSAKRCEWCGVFVKADTTPTAWRVKPAPGHRQNPRSPWNYWVRLLCPSCSSSASSPVLSFWQPSTPAEVQRRRARGWVPQH